MAIFPEILGLFKFPFKLRLAFNSPVTGKGRVTGFFWIVSTVFNRVETWTGCKIANKLTWVLAKSKSELVETDPVNPRAKSAIVVFNWSMINLVPEKRNLAWLRFTGSGRLSTATLTWSKFSVPRTSNGL